MIGEFDDKGIMKIDQNGLIATMHFVRVGKTFYSLTLRKSEKVSALDKDKNIIITLVSNNNEKVEARGDIIGDIEVVKDLYDRMHEIKCNYFKEFDKDLVILKMEYL